MRKPHLPDLTHLQFLVLGVLHGGEQPGRVVREALAGYGVRRSAAAFYQMMARLERDRLVDGYYGQVVVGDQSVTERRYRITPAGAKLWSETRAFYESVGIASLKQRWSDA
jgi:DNA-binding PadR family transcriptional regulator